MNAFNFAMYFDDIFVQCWDGSLKIVNAADNQNIKSVYLPDFVLPGTMKVVGSTVTISQGNRLFGFSIEKLLSNTNTDDQDYARVIHNHSLM